MEYAKRIRWSRFVDATSGRGVILALDHGLTHGPIAGLESVRRLASWMQRAMVQGVIAHKGMVQRLGEAGALDRKGVMLHLSGMSSLSPTRDTKEPLTSVETALSLGADAVSIQLNFSDANYAHNLRLLGEVADQAIRFGLPLLVMMYSAPEIKGSDWIAQQRYLIRLACELGADAVKVEGPRSGEETRCLLDDLSDDIAVFFSGGAKTRDDVLIHLASTAVRNGAAGLCVGRNVFQHSAPGQMLERLWDAVLNPEADWEYGQDEPAVAMTQPT